MKITIPVNYPIVLVALAAIMLGATAIVPNPVSSGLPEDMYRYYVTRADQIRHEAEGWRSSGFSAEYAEMMKSSDWAHHKADYWRDAYNRELAIRLERDLHIAGDSKLFWQEYNARKIS